MAPLPAVIAEVEHLLVHEDHDDLPLQAQFSQSVEKQPDLDIVRPDELPAGLAGARDGEA